MADITISTGSIKLSAELNNSQTAQVNSILLANIIPSKKLPFSLNNK